MKDLLDVHTHSIASGHAYSTVREMVQVAKEKGLKLLGFAEHGPAMPGTCHEIYFWNCGRIRSEVFNNEIDVINGVELNIIDFTGKTDITPRMRSNVAYAIASLHDVCINAGTREQNTYAIIGAMKDPIVKIIGHPDNDNYPVDFEAIVKAAKEHHVLLEVNNSSYRPDGSRQNSKVHALNMLRYCKEYGVHVIMDSDAHIDADVGSHQYSQMVLAEAEFPEELVVNTDLELFKSFIKY